MAKYLVRINCEYSTLVEAESEEEAIKEADDRPIDSGAWSADWSGYDVEVYDAT